MNIDVKNIDKLLDRLVVEADSFIEKRLSITGVGDLANVDNAVKSKLEYINLLQTYKEYKTSGDVKPEVVNKNKDVIDKAAIDRKLANIVSCRIKSLNFNFDGSEQIDKFRALSESWFSNFLKTSVNYKETLDSNVRVLDRQLDSSLANCYHCAVS